MSNKVEISLTHVFIHFRQPWHNQYLDDNADAEFARLRDDLDTLVERGDEDGQEVLGQVAEV